jgi:hypothetical protein
MLPAPGFGLPRCLNPRFFGVFQSAESVLGRREIPGREFISRPGIAETITPKDDESLWSRIKLL